ncbi:MAG: hypothetical protein M3R03_04080 [Pseudomonadota bacterium]|nr:hypothetical protein [Pseudomonadota bacterium]
MRDSFRGTTALALIVFLSIGACGTNETKAKGGAVAVSQSASVETSNDKAAELGPRLTLIEHAIGRWRRAANLTEAKLAAEEARNLVVGAAGPYYGDADRDGVIRGASKSGLLPGLGGEEAVAQPGNGNCVVRDILGGSWNEPFKRWSILDAAIKSWTRSHNTFPTLPSHPQRIVGWATLTFSTNNLVTAREYGGHAQLHIDVSTKAFTQCESR